MVQVAGSVGAVGCRLTQYKSYCLRGYCKADVRQPSFLCFYLSYPMLTTLLRKALRERTTKTSSLAPFFLNAIPSVFLKTLRSLPMLLSVPSTSMPYASSDHPVIKNVSPISGVAGSFKTRWTHQHSSLISTKQIQITGLILIPTECAHPNTRMPSKYSSACCF